MKSARLATGVKTSVFQPNVISTQTVCSLERCVIMAGVSLCKDVLLTMTVLLGTTVLEKNQRKLVSNLNHTVLHTTASKVNHVEEVELKDLQSAFQMLNVDLTLIVLSTCTATNTRQSVRLPSAAGQIVTKDLSAIRICAFQRLAALV